MKKTFSLCAIFAIIILPANIALAYTTFKSSQSTTFGGANFKVSTGVVMITNTNANNTRYACAAKNTGGDKYYTATSDTPSVEEHTDSNIGAGKDIGTGQVPSIN